MEKASLLRYESFLLANQLRQSSDDLTKMVRSYAVTGDKKFETYFWNVLNIRDGKKSRPNHYERVYWDFITTKNPAPPFKNGAKASLESLMKKAGFSKEELKFLADAKNRSDKLVLLETIAMNAMKGRFQDDDGEFTIIKDPDSKMAIQILFGEEYHEAKKGIMEPINEFLKAIDQRTYRDLIQANSQMIFYQNFLVVVFSILIISGLLLIVTVNKHKMVLIGKLKTAINRQTLEIKDRKQAEATLKESEEQLDLAIHGANLGMWDWNVKTGEVSYSKRWVEMLGYHLNDLPPNVTAWKGLLHTEDKDRVMKVLNSHFEKDDVEYNVDFRLQTKSGEWKWINGRGRVFVRDEDGKPLRMVGTHIDISGSKQAEKNLRVSEERLRLVVENMPIMMDALDEKSNVIVWNRECERVTGYSANEITENPNSLELLYPDKGYRERMIAELVGLGFHFRNKEFNLTCKDGTEKTISWSNISGKFPMPGWHTWAVGIDVTEQLKVKQAIVRQLKMEGFIAEISASFVNISPDDVDDQVEKWLQQIVEFLGIGRCGIALFTNTNKNLITTHSYTIPGYGSDKGIIIDEQLPWYYKWMTSGKEFLFENLPDDLPEEAVAERDYCIQSGLKSVIAFPYHHEGRLFADMAFASFDEYSWPENILKQLRLISGILIGALIRKQAQEFLKSAEKKYRDIFDNTIVGIFQTTPDGLYLDANASMARILGYNSPQELMNEVNDIGRQLYVEQERRLEFIQLLNKKGIVNKFETHLYQKDGKTITLSVTAYVVTDKEGKTKYFEGIAEDITSLINAKKDKEEIQNQLLQTQKIESIGTLASGIAHDFNNILSSILGFSELVKDDLPETETELMENIHQVIIAGHRAKDLVQHILTFSRHSDIDKKPLLILPLIKEVIKFLKASLPASIKINTRFQYADAVVFGDATQVHQVMMNLCTNATHAMEKEGGILDIGLEKELVAMENLPEKNEISPGNYLKITISDSGHGIPDSYLSKIFDPFFTTKERGEGTGMGLSVTHGIIKEMEGNIFVVSEQDIGTTFTIFLPVHKTSVQPDEIEVTTGIRMGQGRILFVDDEKSIILMAKKTLERSGFMITAMDNSVKALSMFNSNPDAFDIIITDLDMPEMNGFELSRHIKNKRQGIPIILCTGFYRNITQQTLNDIGIHTMVMKPIIISDLVDIINHIITSNHEES